MSLSRNAINEKLLWIASWLFNLLTDRYELPHATAAGNAAEFRLSIYHPGIHVVGFIVIGIFANTGLSAFLFNGCGRMVQVKVVSHFVDESF
jgi:uncharacterized membrane protein